MATKKNVKANGAKKNAKAQVKARAPKKAPVKKQAPAKKAPAVKKDKAAAPIKIDPRKDPLGAIAAWGQKFFGERNPEKAIAAYQAGVAAGEARKGGKVYGARRRYRPLLRIFRKDTSHNEFKVVDGKVVTYRREKKEKVKGEKKARAPKATAADLSKVRFSMRATGAKVVLVGRITKGKCKGGYFGKFESGKTRPVLNGELVADPKDLKAAALAALPPCDEFGGLLG